MRPRVKSIILFLAILLAPLGTVGAGEVLYQYSTIDALLAGLYDGGLTMGELKRHGNLGLGTFNALDGEMVLLDGKVYQVKVDGKAYLTPDHVKTPFAAVTFFTPRQTIVVKEAKNFQDLTQHLDQALPSPNLFYAFRIDGCFKKVKARSVPRQTRPYPKLVQAAEHQKVFNFSEVEGTVVGFRFPEYSKSIGVSGYHLHFLTKDRTQGGHILDLTLENLKVQTDHIPNFTLTLPQDKEFYQLNLNQDRTKELEKVEK